MQKKIWPLLRGGEGGGRVCISSIETGLTRWKIHQDLFKQMCSTILYFTSCRIIKILCRHCRWTCFRIKKEKGEECNRLTCLPWERYAPPSVIQERKENDLWAQIEIQVISAKLGQSLSHYYLNNIYSIKLHEPILYNIIIQKLIWLELYFKYMNVSTLKSLKATEEAHS